ncbi:hypothetical protein ACFV0B_24325 [Streptomyces xanthophaeus]|uniref:effector-associated constant component EACC1 n=1 Tax=Streptomyces xanthophaeus TaxID=67385 RepID=UPI003678B6E4
MNITIAEAQAADIAPAVTEGELRSLCQWLRDDSRVRRHAEIALGGPEPDPGSMGSPLEYVQLALDTGFDIASLAVAWFTWRATRPRQPAVTFEHEGVTVTLSGEDPETAARLLEALTRRDG